MALTAAKVQDLEDHGFDELFNEHHELWEAKARAAYAFAQKRTLIRKRMTRPLPRPHAPLTGYFASRRRLASPPRNRCVLVRGSADHSCLLCVRNGVRTRLY
jgi:hypothetical protein